MGSAPGLYRWLDDRRRAREWRRFAELLPPLASAAEGLDTARATLEPHYRDYVSQVSTPKMAVSLDTAALLAALCRYLAPRRILDLGSGFSSFALRHPVAGCEGATRVSVDDDARWLEQTAGYLERQGLTLAGLESWSDFRVSSSEPFDLVFHDLGSMQQRVQALAVALALTRERTGVLVLDDVHKRRYRRVLRRDLPHHLHHYRYLELPLLTRDGFGRYSSIVTQIACRKGQGA